MTTTTLPRPPATVETERDRAIHEIKRIERETAAELARLKPELDKAIADMERLEEPKKRWERLGNQYQSIQGTATGTISTLRRQIEKDMPAVLKFAIADVKAQVPIRTGDRRERCEDAVRRLEALTYQAGDLLPSIKAILTELSQGDLEDLAS